MSIADEFPLVEDEPLPPDEETTQQTETQPEEGESRLRLVWSQLQELGFAEPALRLGTHLLLLAFVVLVVWAIRRLSLHVDIRPQGMLESSRSAAFAAPLAEESQPADPTERAENLPLPDFVQPWATYALGIPRWPLLHTTIPTRPRVEVITYVVQPGDTVFGIAEKFGLRPETIFWGNREILGDNPHNLRAGQELNILPVDGTYHKWSAGESFTRVAEFYGVDPQTIIEWPGNHLDEYAFDVSNPDLEPGSYLIIPGGRREFIDWGPPRIPRSDPAVARTYGPGHCGSIVDGAVGSGTFIWPTTVGYLSGYDYSPATNHNGIDIAGSVGNPVYAVDAGVVVYAGWSNFGYGYLIVLDHGNGWQSLYAHLSAIYVICGQSVFQGTTIGAVGNSGNSSGPHLHFELMYGTAKVNPWNYISP